MNLREEIKKVVLLPLRSWAHEYMPDKEAEKEIKKRIDELVKIAEDYAEDRVWNATIGDE